MKKGRPTEVKQPDTVNWDSTAKTASAPRIHIEKSSGRHEAANEQSRTDRSTKPEGFPETISGRLALVFKHERLSPQKFRLLKFIARLPDSFTHEIGRECAVGFPPNRLGELNKEVLWRYGLLLHCHRPEQWLKNRYGDESKVHQWQLILQPVQGREAA